MFSREDRYRSNQNNSFNDSRRPDTSPRQRGRDRSRQDRGRRDRSRDAQRRESSDSRSRRSGEVGYDQGWRSMSNERPTSSSQDLRLSFERGMNDDGGAKIQMTEELRMREQQLAFTSSLLEKQSMMLKNLEANLLAPNPMMIQQQQMQQQQQRQGFHPGPPNMMPMGPMGPPPGLRMRSPPRFPRQNRDSPSPKRFKRFEFNRNDGNRQSERGRPFRLTAREGKKACNWCNKVGHLYKTCPDRLAKKPSYKVALSLKRDKDRKPSASATSTKDSKPLTNTKDSKPPVKNSNTNLRRNNNRRGNGSGYVVCKLCKIPTSNLAAHNKDPDHVRKYDMLKAGCKICNKKMFNSMNQLKKHQTGPMHKAMVIKKKKILEQKLGPYSSTVATGSDYVIPVSGYFCKLCKKFYNKESYAKEDHCQTKPHYDKVSALLNSKYDTAIGAKFQEIFDKVKADTKDPEQLESQIVEALKKVDFTGLKPLAAVKKPVTEEKVKPEEVAVKNGEAAKPEDKPTKDDDVIVVEDDQETKTEEETVEKDNVEEDTKEEAPKEEKIGETTEGDNDEDEHPDFESMEVVDEAV